jgi:hypothetical protein
MLSVLPGPTADIQVCVAVEIELNFQTRTILGPPRLSKLFYRLRPHLAA